MSCMEEPVHVFILPLKIMFFLPQIEAEKECKWEQEEGLEEKSHKINRKIGLISRKKM